MLMSSICEKSLEVIIGSSVTFGKKTFDVSDEELSFTEDIAATIASFVLTPDVSID